MLTVLFLQGETIAYAVHCQQEAQFDRPIAGHANLCPSTLLPEEQHVRTLLSTVKHEVRYLSLLVKITRIDSS